MPPSELSALIVCLRLGAGCGLLGLGLSRLGCEAWPQLATSRCKTFSAFEVLLTEQQVAMENLLRNVEARGVHDPGECSVRASQAANEGLEAGSVPAKAQARLSFPPRPFDATCFVETRG